jgi:hypothetical protein
VDSWSCRPKSIGSRRSAVSSSDGFPDELFCIFRGDQRAIGEIMIADGEITCIGYAEFCSRMETDPPFSQWIASLSVHIEQLPSANHPHPRLVALQNQLIDLINLLDPESARGYPTWSLALIARIEGTVPVATWSASSPDLEWVFLRLGRRLRLCRVRRGPQRLRGTDNDHEQFVTAYQCGPWPSAHSGTNRPMAQVHERRSPQVSPLCTGRRATLPAEAPARLRLSRA